MGKRWGRRGVAAAVVGLVGVVGISACGGGGDESSDSSESTEGDGGSESESATEPTSDESPSGQGETPSGEESSSGGEVSTADVEFTEWELERRATPPPERPAEMDDPGEAGAIATAEYFVELMAFAEETGVIEDLEDISSDECQYCDNYMNLSREAAVEGVYALDAGLDIFGHFAGTQMEDGAWAIQVDAGYPSRVTVDSQGEQVGDRNAHYFTQFVLVERRENEWIVRDAYTEEVEAP